jgi:hypothetical protein
LLTDLARNLLADFKRQALVGSRFEMYGLKRIIRDLLCFPGTLTFDDQGKLVYGVFALKVFLHIAPKRYISGF